MPHLGSSRHPEIAKETAVLILGFEREGRVIVAEGFHSSRLTRDFLGRACKAAREPFDPLAVDFQGVLAFGQGDLIGKRVGVGMPLAADFDALLDLTQVRAGLEEIDPRRKGFVRVGLAGKEEVKTVEQGSATERLMGVEIVTQQGDWTREIAGGVVFQPAFGGRELAILLGVAILRGDELGPQGDDL